MKKLAATLLVALALIFAGGPVFARGVVIVGGYGYGGWGPPTYYYPGYPAYYVAPPPVIYSPAPVIAPPVSAPVYYAQQPVPLTPPASANQTSPTFVDATGRTCRHYELTAGAGPAYGTACLMADGSWQTVP